VIHLLQDFLPEFKKNNMVLGIENHDRFKAQELAAIMEGIGSDRVGICLDCVNSMGAGEGLEYVADVLAPYTVNLHIKDFAIHRLPHKMGFTITGAPAGTGMTNVPLLMEKLTKYNRCHSAVLEQWVPWNHDLNKTIQLEREWAEAGVNYLKSLPYFSSNQMSK
jgi:sugar phosphate isomerase/epimerase